MRLWLANLIVSFMYRLLEWAVKEKMKTRDGSVLEFVPFVPLGSRVNAQDRKYMN